MESFPFIEYLLCTCSYNIIKGSYLDLIDKETKPPEVNMLRDFFQVIHIAGGELGLNLGLASKSKYLILPPPKYQLPQQ